MPDTTTAITTATPAAVIVDSTDPVVIAAVKTLQDLGDKVTHGGKEVKIALVEEAEAATCTTTAAAS
ncbi:MAG: hypothetical protein HQK97_04540 [Nitrospirae bacterium]|nr:hypothetical protein [Nitrospirota bacterium]